ncbi:MAG: heavy metal translocating P-type ATPase, partial [Planctomycetota bacterium]|jgi:Cu2+-exporting ATPase|nr:heavy metal translocating P-type ATPase [Planctomycetota bacterium]
VEGEALVNQAALTGEVESSHKRPGLTAFAGTTVEEGRLIVRTDRPADRTRLREIVRLIAESETLKAGIQARFERLSGALVPYSLFLSLFVLLITRDAQRAASALLVDYSCAIRISTPLAILSAIREGSRRNVLIKGGRPLEAIATADCLALDKTGTLTLATPSVAGVRAFDGWEEAEILRAAACLEEHFPHPVARAVVREAERRDLRHQEKHAEPEYILAHGISSRLDGRQIWVGSAHFVLDDQGAEAIPEVDAAARFEADRGRSLISLAVGGRVKGIVAIEDPIRPDAARTLASLAADGMGEIIILTGDGEKTALALTAELGVGVPRAGLLPADKARIIQELTASGRRVMFVGDGMNDSPALSAAGVGVSLKEGADLAKDVSGLLLLDGRLSGLVFARRLSRAALARIHRQFWFIMGLNSMLLALGLAGSISPWAASLLHNVGTLAVAGNSVRRLLPNEEE